MSKQHLADMLKSITVGDMDAAATHFSNYTTEKSQEILANNQGDEQEVDAEAQSEAGETNNP